MKNLQDNRLILRKAVGIFLLVFFSIGTVLVTLLYLFYSLQTKSHLDGLLMREQQTVELTARTAANNLRIVVADLKQLSQQNELQDYLAGNTETLNNIAAEYSALSAARGLYDQVRLLDANGKEAVRVNFAAGSATVVPNHLLQNKASRYYVKETLKLDSGDVFVSPLDLNIERGVVERPLKPMIRFGTPVFDTSGNLQGLIMLNYLAGVMLEQTRQISDSATGESMLVNNDGYWLLSPQSDDEWGFVFAAKRQQTFSNRFPNEWRDMSRQSTGQLLTENGLFSYSTLYILQEGKIAIDTMLLSLPEAKLINLSEASDALDDARYSWKLLSYIEPDILHWYESSLKSKLLMLSAVLLLLVAAGSFFVALAHWRRGLQKSQLEKMAHFDMLTGLPNRTLFFDRLRHALKRALRYRRAFGLLYLDLDSFKAVNDTLGHAAGDQLLVGVSQRLLQSVRESDTVARLGGDEFVILLSEVESQEGCESAAEKILNAFKTPFSLADSSRIIGLSIGISHYPEHGHTADDLLKHSDKAMYHVKRKGKRSH